MDVLFKRICIPLEYIVWNMLIDMRIQKMSLYMWIVIYHHPYNKKRETIVYPNGQGRIWANRGFVLERCLLVEG